MDAIIDLWQYFYYRVLQRAPKVDLSVVPRSFGFTPHYDEVNGVYWVESKELPDFEATGKTLEELASNIQDTLFVYFDIPRYFAKQSKDLPYLDMIDPRTGEPKRVTTVQRDQLEEMFAGA